MNCTMEVLSRIAFSDTHPSGLDDNGGHYSRKTGNVTTIKSRQLNQQRKKKACWISSTGKIHTADATKLERTCQQYTQ